MKTGTLLVITVLLSAIGTLGYFAVFDNAGVTANDNELPKEETCGPTSVWYVLQRLGQPIEIRQIKTYFENGTCDGTTFSELKQCFDHFGMEASVSKVGWQQLSDHQGAAILYVNDNHFVAIDTRERPDSNLSGAGQLRVYDPNRIAAIWMDRNELDQIWSGDVLLVSESPPGKKRGPAFSFDHCLKDVGLVRDVFSLDFDFPVQNTGDEPLTLKVVGTSCKCNKASFTSKVLEPGETASLRSEYELKSKTGRFNGIVVVETNDPTRKHVKFNLRGAVYRTDLLTTQSVLMGRIDPGSSNRYAVAAMDPGEGRLRILNVSSELKQKVAHSSTQPVCKITVNPFDEVSMGDRKKHNLTTFDSLIFFDVVVPPDCATGPFEFTCVVETNIPASPTYEMSVQGWVRPDLVAKPQALVLELDKDGNSVSGQFEIRSRSGSPIKHVKTSLSGGLLLNEASDSCDSGSAIIDFKLDIPPNTESKWRDGTLTCVTQDNRSVDVPFLIRSPSEH